MERNGQFPTTTAAHSRWVCGLAWAKKTKGWMGEMKMGVAFHLVHLCTQWYIADKHHSPPWINKKQRFDEVGFTFPTLLMPFLTGSVTPSTSCTTKEYKKRFYLTLMINHCTIRLTSHTCLQVGVDPLRHCLTWMLIAWLNKTCYLCSKATAYCIGHLYFTFRGTLQSSLDKYKWP